MIKDCASAIFLNSSRFMEEIGSESKRISFAFLILSSSSRDRGFPSSLISSATLRLMKDR